MNRAFLACVALLCACNSAPKEECTPYAHSLVSAATPPESCDGVCASVPITTDGGDASANYVFCTIDCTDGGNAVCTAGTTCISGAPITTKSYCLVACGGDAGCPTPLTCIVDAGVCL